ncbi:MAG: hypothetical protein PHQ11_07360 [Paludibacter sp.]|jgi:hypothetical protein|nr:hypothetical protein [Paludibacter sp.]
MNIISIFADQLFAFHYDHETHNELHRLLALWTDTAYLYQFVKQNRADTPQKVSISTLVNQLLDNANEIDDAINEITTNPERCLEEFFKPLNDHELHIIELSRQKGRKNYLRLYAIRIDKNCFVITGGTIKFHYKNKDRPHTQIEMLKIERCRDFLKGNNVFDADSFFEFLNEQL